MILGLRCSNKDYTFAVMDGTKQEPRVIASGNVAFPVGFPKTSSVKWFLQEIETLLASHGIDKIAIKAFEGRTRGSLFVDRIDHEAMVFLAASHRGSRAVFRKVKSTIAKDLGLKGRAHYLRTALDTSVIHAFDDYPEKTQEAILAAWSELA